ncbi:MAG: efflux RND transporter periplasmic adaptor subunit [Deltaproteobacteria bacterium]|nr:efflux RND transporter periplasmic adaptor subunit [Deltaproteobacteria bacterium]
MKKRIIIVVFLVLLFGVSFLVYFGQRKNQSEELYYSGTIETKQANLSFQVSSRVVDVFADEGQWVEKGQLLAILDQAEFLARLSQAKANMEVSKKALSQAEVTLEIAKTALPADVERAEAGVKALKAQLDELEAGYRSQDIEKARLALSAAEATLEVAKKDKDRYDRLFQETIASEKERDAVNLRYETALREYESAKENLDQIREGFRSETIRTAMARLEEGEAVLKQARINLKKIEANEKEIEAAHSRVQAAEAAVMLAEAQMEFTRLNAPFNGVIVNRNIEQGEVVSPGREVLSLSDLSSVDLKIFINETEIGKIKPGLQVDVKIDTFPNKIFKGTISYISPEGEFTPKVIQTRKERVKLVYLVKVSIPNPDLELKSGMPADAWIR